MLKLSRLTLGLPPKCLYHTQVRNSTVTYICMVCLPGYIFLIKLPLSFQPVIPSFSSFVMASLRLIRRDAALVVSPNRAMLMSEYHHIGLDQENFGRRGMPAKTTGNIIVY